MLLNNPSPQLTHNEQQADSSPAVVPESMPLHALVPDPVAIEGHYEIIRANLAEAATFTLVWVLSVVKMVLKILTLPVAIAFAGWILVAIISHSSSTAVSSIAEAVSPICSIPLVSSIPICSKFQHSRPTAQEPSFTELMEVQKGLLPVLEAAGSGTNLAHDFKRVEMKISDLNTLVQVSDLANKGKISASLDEFEASAAKVTYQLSRMESNVEGAVGVMLATDDYVIQSLENIAHQGQQKSIMAAIISPFVAYPASRNSLIEIFNHMSNITEMELQELIESTLAATGTLDQLRAHMKYVHRLVSEAQGKTTDNLERTLADLWTMVGGNRAKLAKFAGHRSLLSQIANYHSTASQKVGQALVELYRLEHDIKRLRTRVARQILVDEPTIPLELHIESLRKGIEVLAKGKFMAKQKQDQLLEQIGNRKKYVRVESA